ncbi:hypothetical protein BDB00DRAFT_618260 [Zychaea mexicana]|uniref:uncharacterized protein n=1 Tax=Zychaea mexicana TaxID=64656 RepID=UPI0022FDE1F6|nr:uncharacterized protein BDB00DRAFT_618260 [Zychaea mexicana]KAI9489337.1 hypothetical protein BDB00DRAFT_618260 [Zychaea mexicana]
MLGVWLYEAKEKLGTDVAVALHSDTPADWTNNMSYSNSRAAVHSLAQGDVLSTYNSKCKEFYGNNGMCNIYEFHLYDPIITISCARRYLEASATKNDRSGSKRKYNIGLKRICRCLLNQFCNVTGEETDQFPWSKFVRIAVKMVTPFRMSMAKRMSSLWALIMTKIRTSNFIKQPSSRSKWQLLCCET